MCNRAVIYLFRAAIANIWRFVQSFTSFFFKVLAGLITGRTYKISKDGDEHDPQEYSLSTYIKFRDVKRFMVMDSRYGVPFVIAKGVTKPVHGICLETREWKRNLGIKYKGSHVDWWLYTDAEPYKEFEVFENENRKDI